MQDSSRAGASTVAFNAVDTHSRQPPPIVTLRPPMSTMQPSLASIYAAQETVQPSSPTSNVKGAAFDRIVQIWLENMDFDDTAANPDMQWIAEQGILLTNYFGVTHPSQPNYAAVVGGDYWGMDEDGPVSLPENISTVVDLLDTKGISWGEYMEHLPYPGFGGFNFSNQATYEDDYVRKHNPLILYDSVAHNATRVKQIKNFTSFDGDLRAEKIPQWSFITPNMTNDAHDTNLTFAATWTRNFLEPLVKNPYFMEKTLIIVSFDENDRYPVPNRVFTVLLGGAIPPALQNTTDTLYYNHYSTLSTTSVNWDLPSLGRWDCNANVFAFAAPQIDTGAAHAHAQNANVSLEGFYWNVSYPGPLSDYQFTPGWWPAPNTREKCRSGRGVLPAVVATWGANQTGSDDPIDTRYGQRYQTRKQSTVLPAVSVEEEKDHG
ncbi:phosphoesterase family-domain-containing protein [Lasiosphaeria hispida]|uniref:Phosphoesterase family-domain-containing protein n=1 Tax=Lasiosphaeria hispida TaxID=260671 RepID=A0AAJ0HFT9_9PEZI|nr:phosphoesterase family-domain-containing protein [Lasiosphaeria hispida]